MAPFFSRLAVAGLTSKFGTGKPKRGGGSRTTITFNGPGSSTTSSTPFSVPYNPSPIIISCEGEYGGSGPGGAGGLVSASFSGLAGQTLVVSFAGGGPGSPSGGYRYSRPAALQRGGHYAGVFVTSVSHPNSLIIAGGGGAGGHADVSSGGAGGGSTGGSSPSLGPSGSGPGVPRVGGAGGTQSAGGAGGSGYEGTAGSGSALQGGSGYSSDIGRSSSGSGGGGYYGGGGGGSGYDSENYASAAGGGGGSGFIRNDGTTISNSTGGSTSPSGKVTIEYYP